MTNAVSCWNCKKPLEDVKTPYVCPHCGVAFALRRDVQELIPGDFGEGRFQPDDRVEFVPVSAVSEPWHWAVPKITDDDSVNTQRAKRLWNFFANAFDWDGYLSPSRENTMLQDVERTIREKEI